MQNKDGKSFKNSKMDVIFYLIQFKELEKARKEIAARVKNSKNPFLFAGTKNDHSMYK